MTGPKSVTRVSAALLAGALICPLLGLASEYGRLAGVVSDDHGNPLMGATVLIIGPLLIPTAGAGDRVERVVTDAKGKFAVGNLIPGWYSLHIVSPTRLPVHRNGIKVQAGQTSTLRFELADAFAPLRFQIPNKGNTSLADDWKWVLRTSAATRPILRFRQAVDDDSSNSATVSLPAERRLIAMVPESSGPEPLTNEPGMATFMAYLRPLSPDTELLTIGSVAASGST